MNLNFSFIDNNLNINSEHVTCLEIENREYFYRIVSLLNKYSQGLSIDEDLFITNTSIKVVIDYFNLDFNNRKAVNSYIKVIKDYSNETKLANVIRYYGKLKDSYENLISDIDLPLSIEANFNLDSLSKIFNLKLHRST